MLRQDVAFAADLCFETGLAVMCYEGTKLQSGDFRQENPAKGLGSRVLVAFPWKDTQVVALVRAVWWEVVLQLGKSHRNTAPLFRKVKLKLQPRQKQDSTHRTTSIELNCHAVFTHDPMPSL